MALIPLEDVLAHLSNFLCVLLACLYDSVQCWPTKQTAGKARMFALWMCWEGPRLPDPGAWCNVGLQVFLQRCFSDAVDTDIR